MSLKERLSTISKGSSSAHDYLRNIHSIGDELALIGHPVDDLDLVIAALNGLRPQFREYSTSVRTRDAPILFDELFDKLVDFEIYILRDEQHIVSVPATANWANRANHHTNRKYQNPSHNSHYRKSSNSDSSRPLVVCQFYDKDGHLARTCYKINGYPPKNKSKPYANHVDKRTANDSPWLLDSGASHHVTNDLANLSFSKEVSEPDHLFVADGKPLSIMNNGNTHIFTPSKTLALHDVLHVPNITQNLVSVSQLCQTNDVSIEFFPWHFEIKDLRTGRMLLRGRNEDNLYKLPPSRILVHLHMLLNHPQPNSGIFVLVTLILVFSVVHSSLIIFHLNCPINIVLIV